MKVAISGSRTFTDRALVEQVIDRLIERGDHILYGDAPNGVDRFAGEYIEHRADDIFNYDRYDAEWETYGKPAGHIRNGWMIHDADMLIAIFADGPHTPGTRDAVDQAHRKGIPVHIWWMGEWMSVEG